MNMKTISKITISIASIALFLNGCAQNRSDNEPKRERLRAHENYQLTQQLQQSNQTIQLQSEQIDQLQSELQETTKLYQECMNKEGTQFMELITPIMDELEATRQENQQLKQQLAQFTDQD